MLSLAPLLQQFKNPLSPHITSRRLLISPSPRSPSVCGSVSYFLYSPACCVSVRENVKAWTSPRVPGRPTQVLWVQTEYAQPQWARNYHRLKRGRFSICQIIIIHVHVSFISQYLRNLFVLKLSYLKVPWVQYVECHFKFSSFSSKFHANLRWIYPIQIRLRKSFYFKSFFKNSEF